MILNSTNESVSAVNLKNKFTFLDPPEALANVNSTISVPMKVQRQSVEKRSNSLYYDKEKAARFLYKKYNKISHSESSDCDSSTSDLDLERVAQNDDDSLVLSSLPHVEPETDVEDLIPLQTPPPVQSTSSIPTGLYGRSSTNVSKYIKMRVMTNPHYAIPEPSSTVSTGSFFLLMSKILWIELEPIISKRV